MAISEKIMDKGLACFEEFSKRLFYAATGALALSVTFKSAISANSPEHQWVLSAAWILLTLSILAQLWEQVNLGIHFIYAGSGDIKAGDIAMKKYKRAVFFSMVTFALGIVALCTFAVLNNVP